MIPGTKYEVVIGLEVHVQLLTRTKIFCGCPAEYGSKPNTRTCPVCLGLPGALPVLNREAVSMALRAGLALGCSIAPSSIFARKNYFYPDCPKNYQISMYDRPLCKDGWIEIESEKGERKIRIQRIHLEEDAGKLVHDGSGTSLIDFNRCGVPLIEIVTEPDIHSASEAGSFLQKLRQIVKYLGICDGNLEEGSMRCDINISIMPSGAEEYGTRTEIKNLNSFKAVMAGIKYEIERQEELLGKGEKIQMITSHWDASKKRLDIMRSKEEVHDYRYFAEPDLMPLIVDDKMVSIALGLIPELPDKRKKRFCDEYKLSGYEAGVLTAEKDVADYYEVLVAETSDPKISCNWLMREVLGELNSSGGSIGDFPLRPENLATLITLVREGVVSGSAGSEVFNEMVSSGEDASFVIDRLGLEQISSSEELEVMVDEVITRYPEEVSKYRNGSSNLLVYLVGQVMKMSNGRANPKLVNELFIRKLNG